MYLSFASDFTRHFNCILALHVRDFNTWAVVRISIVRLTMRAALILSILWLTGCASHSHIARLSDREYLELVKAGYDFALESQPVPEPIQKLRPIQVYYFRGNVVIALQKNAHEERGYYIVPPVSSYNPCLEDQEWTLKPLNIPNEYFSAIYEYCRKK